METRVIAFITIVLFSSIIAKVRNIENVGVIHPQDIEAHRAINRYRAIHGSQRVMFIYQPYFASKSHANECAYVGCNGHKSKNGDLPKARLEKVGFWAGILGENVGGGLVMDGCVSMYSLTQDGHRYNLLKSSFVASGAALNEPKSFWPTNDDDEDDALEYQGAYVLGKDSLANVWRKELEVDYDERSKIEDISEFPSIFEDKRNYRNSDAQIADKDYFELISTGFI